MRCSAALPAPVTFGVLHPVIILPDSVGQADATKINGIFDAGTKRQVKEVQALLGLAADGIVGKITRSVWKKVC